MSSIKVVDVNEEARQCPASNSEAPQQELTPVVKETSKEETLPVVEESKEEITNNVVEEVEPTIPVVPNTEAKVTAEAKVKAQDRLITCPKCNKTMKTKSYRYNHEKICQGNLTDRPVKPKAKAKPKPETIHETIDEETIERPPAPKQPNEVMSHSEFNNNNTK